MDYYAGIDVGATNLRLAIADKDGTILESRHSPTPHGPHRNAITDEIFEGFRELCGDIGILPRRIRSVGIGSIGPLNLDRGTIENPVNLPERIDSIALREPLKTLIGSDHVYLVNDATAGVIGERSDGSDAPENMIYLTLSSGIGAGVVVDGHVLNGRNGNIAEIGHLVVDPRGRMQCGCGRNGHWEAYCGGNNIPDYTRYVARKEELTQETALSLTDPSLSAADVFDSSNDPLVDRVIERITRWNSIGVTNLIHSFAPDELVVGGTVALENKQRVIQPIKQRVPKLIVTSEPVIRPSRFGHQVVLRGAIVIAITQRTPQCEFNPDGEC